MGRFSRPPTPRSVEEFVAAADAPPAEPAQTPPRNPPTAPRPRPRDVRKPWEQHRRKAKPRRNFTLRLNDYELALLRYVTERVSEDREEDVSMHQIVKEIVLPALESRAGLSPQDQQGRGGDSPEETSS